MVILNNDLTYLIILLLCSLICLYISFYCIKHPKKLLSKILSYIAFTSFLFSFVLLLAIISNNNMLSTFLLGSQYLFYALACMLWFIFICIFMKIKESEWKKANKYFILVSIILVIATLINPFYLTIITNITSSGFKIGGIAYFVYLFTLCVTIISLAILWKDVASLSPRFKKSIYLISSILIFTGLPSILLVGTGFYDFIITGITLPIAVLLLFYYLYYTKLLNMVPFPSDAFINNVNAGMIFFDSEDKLRDYNNIIGDAMHLTKDDLGTTIDDLFKNKSYSKKILNFYKESYDSKQIKINDELYLDIKKAKLYEGTKFLGSVYTTYNITKMKIAEAKTIEAIKTARKQTKELEYANKDISLLLEEVHHRVKNNLQLILSFINLDKHFKNEDQTILDNTVNRISSMALIYESTYREGSFSRISVGNYAKSSCEKLSSVFSPSKDVLINYDIDELYVDMDLISPLSLIYNEILTNCFKHAFTAEDKDKQIDIIIKVLDESKAYIMIKDNGKGLGKDFDMSNTQTLGFTIIKGLTDQIRGNLEIVECEGTALKVEFPIGD